MWRCVKLWSEDCKNVSTESLIRLPKISFKIPCQFQEQTLCRLKIAPKWNVQGCHPYPFKSVFKIHLNALGFNATLAFENNTTLEYLWKQNVFKNLYSFRSTILMLANTKMRQLWKIILILYQFQSLVLLT